ncbi:arginine transporter [Antarctobacter sp.]|uniref:arginine transporter n=1 Tax=Antarctobacter sp. TaxID=1872577 RepID=UPI003A91FB68
MKQAVILAACLGLAACGGGTASKRSYGAAPQVRVSSGPIADACMRAGRSGASRQRCGCVQTVADSDLTSSDQRLAVTFFADPHRAQEIRQSDNPRNEAFWKRYKAFAARAESVCRGT